MLQAFVDDSASDRDDQSLYLAGYIHFAPKWAEFSNAWDKALKSSPRIEYFRMAEAENLSGQFKGWKQWRRDRKIEMLASTIEQCNPCSVVCSVSRHDYAEVVQPIAPYDLRSPYFICFYGVIVAAARWMAESPEYGSLPIDFIFDEQGPIGMEAVSWYYVVKGLQDQRFQKFMGSTPVFRDDKVVVPLQAADMLAWHIRRKRESRYSAEQRSLTYRLLGHDHIEMECPRPYLQSLADRMAKIPDVHESRDRKSWKQYQPTLRAMLTAPPDSPLYIANRVLKNPPNDADAVVS